MSSRGRHQQQIGGGGGEAAIIAGTGGETKDNRMMLRSLVKKLASQSLDEAGGVPATTTDAAAADPVSNPVYQQQQQEMTNITASDNYGDEHANDLFSSKPPVRKSPRFTSPPVTKLKVANATGADTTSTESQDLPTKKLLQQDRDSGTESDDEELERISTASSVYSAGVRTQTSDYGSHKSGVAGNSTSPAAITRMPLHLMGPVGSPTQLSCYSGFSEHDANSRDSMGCESGIVLHGSGDRDSTDTPTELLYWHSRQLYSVVAPPAPARVLRNVIVPAARCAAAAPVIGGRNNGAFRPVPQRFEQSSSCRSVEKRKWSATSGDSDTTESAVGYTPMMLRSAVVAAAVGLDEEPPDGGGGDSGSSPMTSARLSSSSDGARLVRGQHTAPSLRETLQAARRTPVKLVIPPSDTHDDDHKNNANGNGYRFGMEDENEPAVKRPSLDFNKMRQKMMKPGRKQPSTAAIDRNKQSGAAVTPPYHLRSRLSSSAVGADCVFRPVQSPSPQQMAVTTMVNAQQPAVSLVGSTPPDVTVRESAQ